MTAHTGTHAMSPTMWTALGQMPIRLDRTAIGWCLPINGPHGATLSALRHRGLIRFDPHQHAHVRTAAGDKACNER